MIFFSCFSCFEGGRCFYCALINTDMLDCLRLEEETDG